MEYLVEIEAGEDVLRALEEVAEIIEKMMAVNDCGAKVYVSISGKRSEQSTCPRGTTTDVSKVVRNGIVISDLPKVVEDVAGIIADEVKQKSLSIKGQSTLAGIAKDNEVTSWLNNQEFKVIEDMDEAELVARLITTLIDNEVPFWFTNKEFKDGEKECNQNGVDLQSVLKIMENCISVYGGEELIINFKSSAEYYSELVQKGMCRKAELWFLNIIELVIEGIANLLYEKSEVDALYDEGKYKKVVDEQTTTELKEGIVNLADIVEKLWSSLRNDESKYLLTSDPEGLEKHLRHVADVLAEAKLNNPLLNLEEAVKNVN